MEVTTQVPGTQADVTTITLETTTDYTFYPVEDQDTELTTSSSATTTTTTTTTLTETDSCSQHHNGYQEFGDRIKRGIEQGLTNDMRTYSRRPGWETFGAKRRRDQFKRWFVNILNGWYQDVTQSSESGTRRCLTDNFPYDSPGNLDKERVFESTSN